MRRYSVEKQITLPTGAKFPMIGLGTFLGNQYVSRISNGIVASAVKTAIGLGYRHFDTAWMYNSEAEVGSAIKEKINDGTVTRQDLFIVTKLWRSFHRREEVCKAFHRSLKELNMDYVDLYLIHKTTGLRKNLHCGNLDRGVAPVRLNTLNPTCVLAGGSKYKFSNDPRQHYPDAEDYTPYFDDVDYVETWKEMEKLVDAGLVRAIGVSNFNIQQIERIQAIARHPLSVVQIELHPYLSQTDLLQFCKKHNIVVTAYSPLACGSKPFVKQPKPVHLNENPIIKRIADKHKKTEFQVVLRYELQLGVVVIPKSCNPKHIQENFQLFDFELSEDDMKEMASLNINYRLSDQHKFKKHKHFPYNDDAV